MRLVLFTNGVFSPMDGSGRRVESMLVAGERILEVGTVWEVAAHPLAPEAKKVDLQGKRVIPGLIDTHVHFAAYAESKGAVDLSKCKSISEVVAKLKERAASLPPNSWIRGMNFDHTNFLEKRMPKREDLDVIENPVFLSRMCFHVHSVNTKALEAGGYLESWSIPEGVERNANGELSGVIYESGVDRIAKAYHKGTGNTADHLDRMAKCMYEFASYGITAFNTTSAEHLGIMENFGIYQDLRRMGKLLQRVTIHFNDLPNKRMQSFFGDNMIRYGGLKLFSDGGFCAQTGAMTFDYKGRPGYKGALNYTDKALYALVLEAQKQGVQVAIHTVGDRALDQVLDVFDAVMTEVPKPYLRHRIIHCYIAKSDQRKRIASLGLIVDIQPRFLADEIDIAESGIPEEALMDAYAWGSLWHDGVLLTGSSDCPAAHPNPWLGIDAAVNRVRAEDRTPVGGWHPEQKLSLDEAIALYTKNGAKAIGMSRDLGTLEPGKLADFVVLEDDPWNMSPEDLGKVRVRDVYRGGEKIYSAKE